MSKVFYDKFLILEEIELELDKLDLEHSERKELEQLIDETIQHRVLDRLLTLLPLQHHKEFLNRFHQAPYDETLLSYIDQRVDESVEEHIKDEVERLKKEILEDIRSGKK